MKKILFVLMTLVATMSINAQTMKFYKGNTLVATYTADQADKVVFADENKISIALDLVSKTSKSLTVNVTPSDQKAPYFLMCELKGYVSSFDTDEDLMEEEIDYWRQKYGTTYADYGFDSFADLLVNGLCCKGTLTDEVFDGLTPETDYVVYAFSIDSVTLKPTSDLYKIEVTTGESEWELLGVGKYQDGILKDLFSLANKEIDIEIYQSKIDKTRYAMKNPYGPDMLYSWYYNSSIPKEMIEEAEGSIWEQTYFEFVIKSDNTVEIPQQKLGLYMNLSNPSFQGWPQTMSIVAGTFADGAVTFPTRGLVLYLGSSGYYANNSGAFKITMPAAKSKAFAKNIKDSIVKTSKKIRNLAPASMKPVAKAIVNAEAVK